MVVEILRAPAEMSEALRRRQLAAFRKFLEDLAEHRASEASPVRGRLRWERHPRRGEE